MQGCVEFGIAGEAVDNNAAGFDFVIIPEVFLSGETFDDVIRGRQVDGSPPGGSVSRGKGGIGGQKIGQGMMTEFFARRVEQPGKSVIGIFYPVILVADV